MDAEVSNVNARQAMPIVFGMLYALAVRNEELRKDMPFAAEPAFTAVHLSYRLPVTFVPYLYLFYTWRPVRVSARLLSHYGVH